VTAQLDHSSATPFFDVVVVGAGFAGLYMLHLARGAGMSAHLIEAGDDVGGTWYWNRYPGARCDFESVDYSYSWDDGLQQDWDWPERFSDQPAIQRYLAHVADRFGLREHITFSTRVTGAAFDENDWVWRVRGGAGELARATFLVMATGSLSTPRLPDLPGLASFAGRVLHTGAWPRETQDFTGRRVGVIGTGSSGVQVSVEIAKQAARLDVFQRTPSYVVPARHEPLSPAELAFEKAHYAERRAAARLAPLGVDCATRPQTAMSVPEADRLAEFERRWPLGGAHLLLAFSDLVADDAANAAVADFIKAKIRSIVRDIRTAAALSSQDYPVGARRLVVGPGFYEMFDEPHVHLVDVRADPIEEVTAAGIRTASGPRELDDLVCATGFDAITGTLLAMDLRGRGGATLREHWAAGPVTYLGVQTPGFPNLFLLNGPGSPSVLSNMVHSGEHSAEFVAELIGAVRHRGAHGIETTAAAARGWMDNVATLAAGTIFPRSATSWYTGGNVPGKPRVFMPYVGGMPAYRETCARVAANGFEGMVIS
jgi:cyclohexanone monooxygenase